MKHARTLRGIGEVESVLSDTQPPLLPGECGADDANVTRGKTLIFKDNAALTKLIYDLNLDSLSQRDIIRAYVEKVIDKVIDAKSKVSCSESLILDLDLPVNIRAYKKQTDEIYPLRVEEMSQAQDNAENEGEEDIANFNTYRQLAEKYRSAILSVLQEELKSRGSNIRVGIMGKLLGKGGMYEVHSCNMGDRDVALKMPRPHILESDGEVHKRNDIKLNNKLVKATQNNENLVKFFGSLMVVGDDGEIYRIDLLEKLDGAMSLTDCLKKLTEDENPKRLTGFLESVFMPILRGVKSLHDEGIVHRDLKPENIFIIKTEEGFLVKVGDYDLRCNSGYRSKNGNISGTPSFTSPERYQLGSITEKSDIYSLGMMLYNFFGGKMPETILSASLQSIGKQKRPELNVAPDIKVIIEKCLKIDPAERPNIDELIDGVQELISEGIEAEIEPAEGNAPMFKAENPADPIHTADTAVQSLPILQPIKPIATNPDTLVETMPTFDLAQNLSSFRSLTTMPWLNTETDFLPFADTELRAFDQIDPQV